MPVEKESQPYQRSTPQARMCSRGVPGSGRTDSAVYSQRWSTTLLLTLNKGTSWGIGTSIEVPGTSHSREVTFSRLKNNSLSLLYLCKFQWAIGSILYIGKNWSSLQVCPTTNSQIVNKSIATNHPLQLANVVTMTFKFMLLSPAGYKKSCMFLTLEIAIQYCILNMQRRFSNLEP